MSPRPPRLRVGAIAIAFAIVTATGCAWFESDEDAEAGQDERDKDTIELAEQVDFKLRSYSSCRDSTAAIIREVWSRYDDQVDEQGRPRRRREGVYVRSIGKNAFRTCRRVLASAPRTPPAMPTLQSQAEATLEAAEAFASLTRELERALESEQRAEDDWSKLAELDPDLRAALKTWREADEALERSIDARHIGNDPLLLGALEGRRSELEIAARALMLEARPIARCLTLANATADDCAEPFKEFDAAFERFDDNYEANEIDADKVFWMSTFAADARGFHHLASEHQRRIAQRKGKDQEIQDLIDAYFALVRGAETLDFDFPGAEQALSPRRPRANFVLASSWLRPGFVLAAVWADAGRRRRSRVQKIRHRAPRPIPPSCGVSM
ncbi:DUF3829 domain-containing protein [Pseudenhygromyxa sp. WMMC2535]|uniref:DUF3829 domain-containing protein n=1 Tax=Pseudenhygromyxa sp. WMMC2535 TaxID=2712867 RepID=UPI0015557E58|nr:DUF3829 domain-containing protein [Pseudenhygromyxa sp. WMMC2535]NVB40939.1 DUF3829 domain-containing protein [Pseudenhygromyxa sp. WMMC2535]